MANSNLAVFEFDSKSVRIVMIDGNPWFVLSDVLKALRSKSRTNDIKPLIDETFGDGYVIVVPILDNLNREQETLVINDSALTFVVSRSRTETGKRLNRWIHSEVLPSIRKTGSYSLSTPAPLSLPEQLAAAGLPDDWSVEKYPLGVPTGEKMLLRGELPGSLEKQEIELTIKLCEAFGKRKVTPEEAAIVALELIPAILLHFRSHGPGWPRETIIKEYTLGDCWWERFFKEPVIDYFRFNPLAPRLPQFAE